MVSELANILASLLTIGQVAEMFDRTEQTVSLWRRKHGLPCVYIAGNRKSAIRFVKEDVIKWAKENRKRLAL